MSKQPDSEQKILRDICDNLTGVYSYGDGLLDSSRRVYATLARHREPSPDTYSETLAGFWGYYDGLRAALELLPPGLLHDESGVVSELSLIHI